MQGNPRIVFKDGLSYRGGPDFLQFQMTYESEERVVCMRTDQTHIRCTQPEGDDG